VVLVLLLSTASALAVDYETVKQQYRSGQYDEAAEAAAAEVERGIWNERWPRLLIQCYLVTGKYQDALAVFEDAVKRYPTSLTLRMMGREAIRLCGITDRDEQEASQILRLLQSSPSRYASRDNLVAAGRFFKERGEDARQILELFYDRVRDADPEHLEAYIATAELALDKGDFKVAADTLTSALKVDDADPQIYYLLARAFEPSDSERASEALAQALKLNSSHVPSLLMQATGAIDREQYAAADQLIKQVLDINRREQDAIALQAVLAHLRGDFEKEKQLRDLALMTWKSNPRVDHLIGKKLSDKYRFAEGAEYQRSALTIDPTYTAASFQLAQDLLRLGHDDVGWELAKTVADEDQYNVVAHNLITLHDRLSGFSVLQAGDIHVRMDPREAEIYGDQVLELLSEAQATLCPKYDVTPKAPVVVEIFPEQKDFAIRTFGLPGGQGFLGVCFGRVITANSPASQGDTPANWKSVLWHEFCHVVTLEKTKNRMPRWLSEGISVYEERKRDAAWGESMTPQYREMLLGEELTPVSELSGAFLSPASPLHLQFAYYESSLVVEFLIDRYGLDAVKQILTDLADGLAINDALARSVGSLEKLDQQFATYAKQVADSFAPDAQWSREGFPERPSRGDYQEIIDQEPNHYWGRMGLAKAELAAGNLDAAKQHLMKLVELGAVTGQRGGPLEMLATVYRKAGEIDKEREIHRQIVELSSDALPSLVRLIDIARDEQDWESVLQDAHLLMSINPLLPYGHQRVSEAAEKLDQPGRAVAALTALTTMEPVDPAGLDFRLARSLYQLDQFARAKDHVLRALDEAPRYRDAHRLLLQIHEAIDARASQDRGVGKQAADIDREMQSPTETESSETESSETNAAAAEIDATDASSTTQGSEP
tara:strand:+ start:301266 stop:303932 length:2667 start_codon:yes stop_codon:yes gene_type:complete